MVFWKTPAESNGGHYHHGLYLYSFWVIVITGRTFFWLNIQTLTKRLPYWYQTSIQLTAQVTAIGLTNFPHRQSAATDNSCGRSNRIVYTCFALMSSSSSYRLPFIPYGYIKRVGQQINIADRLFVNVDCNRNISAKTEKKSENVSNKICSFFINVFHSYEYMIYLYSGILLLLFGISLFLNNLFCQIKKNGSSWTNGSDRFMFLHKRISFFFIYFAIENAMWIRNGIVIIININIGTWYFSVRPTFEAITQ